MFSESRSEWSCNVDHRDGKGNPVPCPDLPVALEAVFEPTRPTRVYRGWRAAALILAFFVAVVVVSAVVTAVVLTVIAAPQGAAHWDRSGDGYRPDPSVALLPGAPLQMGPPSRTGNSGVGPAVSFGGSHETRQERSGLRGRSVAALAASAVFAIPADGRGLAGHQGRILGGRHPAHRKAPNDAEPTSAPLASGGIGTALIGGWATYYADPKQPANGRYAAAGPLLREALGDWRGKVIAVTSGKHSTIVQLVDVCACGERQGLPTIIDLSPAAFRDLAPLSAGVIRVEIELVTLPATDAETVQ